MPVYTQDELDQLAREWVLTYKIVLPPKCTIVVAGAYKGKLMTLFGREFPLARRIVGFEPAEWAASEAIRATEHIRGAQVYNTGLLAEPGERFIDMGEFHTDACSVLAQGEDSREHGIGYFQDAAMALKFLLPIDLFVMNMEGYEYKLLPYITEHVMAKGIKRLAVQFHTKYQPADFGPELSKIDAKYTRVVDNFPQWVYWIQRS